LNYELRITSYELRVTLRLFRFACRWTMELIN